MHRRLGSATLSLLASPGKTTRISLWEKSQWDKTPVIFFKSSFGSKFWDICLWAQSCLWHRLINDRMQLFKKRIIFIDWLFLYQNIKVEINFLDYYRQPIKKWCIFSPLLKTHSDVCVLSKKLLCPNSVWNMDLLLRLWLSSFTIGI